MSNNKWEIKDFLEQHNGELTINGVSSTEIAGKYGTPVFIYSGSRIRHNINRLLKIQDVIDCKLKICYAAKAMSDASVLSVIREAGIDIEVNFGGELKMALAAGFEGKQIIFNGNSKSEEELADAINAGIYAIQSDSFYELELTEKVARRLGKRANVSLRLVPEIESKTLHGLQTALLSSKFGMMPAEALRAFRRWEKDDPYLNLTGIHIHIGSQNPKAEPYRDALLSLFGQLVEISRETGHELSHINIGGGFPVNYLRDDSHVPYMSDEQVALLSTDLEPADILGAAWNALKDAAKAAGASHFIENIELLIEPGRSIVGDAAVCLTQVRNKKERPLGREAEAGIERDVWLLTDAGFNILLSMETYKWYYHLIHATRADESHDTPYKVAGPLCDGGDVYFDIEGHRRLPDHRRLPVNIEPGELLALLNAGAYSVSQMFPYNGRELPKVIVV